MFARPGDSTAGFFSVGERLSSCARNIMSSVPTGLARPTRFAPTPTATDAATPPVSSRELQRSAHPSLRLELDLHRAPSMLAQTPGAGMRGWVLPKDLE